MISKSVIVALVTLSLHAFFTQAAPYSAYSYSKQGKVLAGTSTVSSENDGGDEQCDVPHTVTVTVQPTAVSVYYTFLEAHILISIFKSISSLPATSSTVSSSDTGSSNGSGLVSGLS